MSDQSSSSDKGKKRKRLTNYKNWKDTRKSRRENKILVNYGRQHLSRKGRLIAAKKMGDSCYCTKQCETKFTEAERIEIFNNFWGLGSNEKRWLFIVNHSNKMLKNRSKQRGEPVRNRKYTYKYYLPKTNSDGFSQTQIAVCRLMFVRTLNTSSNIIKTAWQKYDENGIIQQDMRGRHAKNRKVSNE
ncbi:uncharacterized protein LOC114362978 [Ostrinia furnacalis]|uniref:uncharacterized protein LOC114362978 n=1 Tax=Ostrinia furnacalis TaxID=93504 RepID=UPI00103FEB67|nr:uncharacterized protein LOC114362978 [Ostrinia furnacalis]